MNIKNIVSHISALIEIRKLILIGTALVPGLDEIAYGRMSFGYFILGMFSVVVFCCLICPDNLNLIVASFFYIANFIRVLKTNKIVWIKLVVETTFFIIFVLTKPKVVV